MTAALRLGLLSLCLLTVACMPAGPATPPTSPSSESSASSASSASSQMPTSAKSAGKAGWQSFQKPSDAELRKILDDEQFDVTQREGTEPPFHNAYWNNHEDGIYVDIVSGEPLFSSKDKYESGTGWPSFTKPLAPENIVEKTDTQLFLPRTEVRSKYGDSHLGHVFTDGPLPTGLRYCINSAALRFIPVNDLEKEGYGEYVSSF